MNHRKGCQSKIFPDKEIPVSTYDLYDFSGNAGTKVYATGFCNLHDFWLTEFKL
jgi:desulfoferrodoxin (superoxide reductase-like protein)